MQQVTILTIGANKKQNNRREQSKKQTRTKNKTKNQKFPFQITHQPTSLASAFSFFLFSSFLFPVPWKTRTKTKRTERKMTLVWFVSSFSFLFFCCFVSETFGTLSDTAPYHRNEIHIWYKIAAPKKIKKCSEKLRWCRRRCSEDFVHFKQSFSLYRHEPQL